MAKKNTNRLIEESKGWMGMEVEAMESKDESVDSVDNIWKRQVAKLGDSVTQFKTEKAMNDFIKKCDEMVDVDVEHDEDLDYIVIYKDGEYAATVNKDTMELISDGVELFESDNIAEEAKDYSYFWFTVAWGDLDSRIRKPLAIFTFADQQDAESLISGEAADILEKELGRSIDADEFELEVISVEDFMDEYADSKNPNKIDIKKVHMIPMETTEEAKDDGDVISQKLSDLPRPHGLWINKIDLGGHPKTTDASIYLINDEDEDIIISYHVGDTSYHSNDYKGYKGNVDQWMKDEFLPIFKSVEEAKDEDETDPKESTEKVEPEEGTPSIDAIKELFTTLEVVTDDDVHDLAEDLETDAHSLEEVIYKLLKDLLAKEAAEKEAGMTEEASNAGVEKILLKIAKRNIPDFKDFKTRNRDSDDYYDVAVWNIKAALEAAFNVGIEIASGILTEESKASKSTIGQSASDVLNGVVREVHESLDKLSELVDDYGSDDEIGWGHVGSMNFAKGKIKEVIDHLS